jgi:hypothetical protein
MTTRPMTTTYMAFSTTIHGSRSNNHAQNKWLIGTIQRNH